MLSGGVGGRRVCLDPAVVLCAGVGVEDGDCSGIW